MTVATRTWTDATGPIYGGCAPPSGGRPAWRTAMSAGTVALVPGNTLDAVDPEDNPAINPNHPSNAPWHAIAGHAAMVSAWNGMAWDEATCTAWFALDGGHGDYAANAPYKNCLYADTANFTMLRNPSGAIGNLITLNDGQEATGHFADIRLRPGHSYNNNTYVAGLGPVVCRIKGPYSSGATDYAKAYVINETTGEATLLCDMTALSIGQSYGGAVHDAAYNRILTTGNTNTPLTAISLSSGTASNVVASDNNVGNYAKMVVMPAYGLVAFFHTGGSGYPAQFYLRELANLNTMITPTITGSFSAGFSFDGQQGVDWDDVNHCFYLWNNASNTNQVSTLTPSGNPRTAPWTAGTRTFTGVTVTAKAGNGTYGRFGYSARLGGCYLLNATSQQFQFFATE